ncbi:hypothetical protein HZC35_04440 [Candidatus Saganbacteria bacterium]|nr:hypothetical protein [Candidatus Saganbacteria bacterium]
MTVSGIIEKSNSQEMAVSLNQGMLDSFTDKIKDREKGKETRRASDIETSKLMEMNNKDLNKEVLGSLFSKLAAAGISLNPKADLKGKNDELERLLGRNESLEDRVTLKSSEEILKVQKGKGNGEEGEGGKQFLNQNDQMATLLEQFVNLLAEAAVKNAPELAEKIKTLKEKLVQKGISEEKLAQIEKGIGGTSTKALLQALKDGIVLQLLAQDDRVEKGIRNRGINDLKDKLAARFGDEEAEKLTQDAREAAKAELRSFVPEELENALIKKTYLQETEFGDTIKLIKAGQDADFDFNTWINDYWPEKKMHQGLYLMDVPHSATGMNVNTNTDNPTSREQKHGYEYEKEDEKEVLLNRLRALYMQGALRKGFFSSLETIFKVRKLKNGLFRLGVMTPELDDQVKHEAEILAKMKTMEMLQEGLLERATLYDLAGPAYDLIERKIKGLLKNAERLGMPISAEEFNKLRDKANNEIHTLSRKELDNVRSELRQNSSQKLAKKEKHLVRLLMRLADESPEVLTKGDASFSLVDSINR